MQETLSIDPRAASAAAEAPGIVVEGLTVTYKNGQTALRDASFRVPRGTITGLVGVNGAGKSTLFKAIMGFVPAARGKIRILGRTVRASLRENLVAYVPQSEEVDWSFPVLVEDVVMMGRYGRMGFLRRPARRDREAVDEALRRVGMFDLRERQIGELSGGQRKRVFLARALAQDGQVILLDEPFTGVDVRTEGEIVALLRELRDEGRVMLVSTHNLGSVPEFCDRTVFVKGTVLAYGPTETTFTRANLERAFGGVLRHFTLGGELLHDDDDPREVAIITDDERPFVHYGGEAQRATRGEPGGATQPATCGEPGGATQPATRGEPGGAAQPARRGEPGGATQPATRGEPGGATQPATCGEPSDDAQRGEPGGAAQRATPGEPGSAAQPATCGEPGGAAQPATRREPGGATQPATRGEPTR